MKKVFPPRYGFEIGELNDLDKNSLSIWRDKIGAVKFIVSKRGTSSRSHVDVNLKDLKRLRDWLTKIIEYVERD